MVFKNFSYPVAACIGVAIAITSPQSSQALSPDQVSGIAKQVTVLIEGQNPGSGVIINRDGNTYTVLTAFHVVGTPDEYDVVTPTDQRYKLDYNTVKRLPGVDLAVLQFKSDKAYKVAEVGNSNQVSEGKPVYVAGFPVPTQAVNLSIYRFTEGRLTANASKPLADGYALVYDNSTRPGMSGGPVLDGQGSLVGIHGRADAQQQGNVYFKNDTNLGIPIDTFSTMAPKVGVKVDSLPTTPATNTSIPTAPAQNTPTSPPPTTSALNTSPPKPTPPRPPVQNPPSIPQGSKAGDFYLQATDKLQRNNLEGAQKDFDQAIRLNPEYASAYNERAGIKFRRGDRQGALSDLNQAIKIDPEFADPYGGRGILRAVTGNLQGAQSDVEKAVRLKPEIGYTARGMVRWYGSDLRGARSDFDQALSLDSDFKEAYAVHTYRGVLHWQLGNTDGAMQDLNRSIQLQPKSHEAVGLRGLLRWQMNETQGALQDFEQAIRINPDRGEIHTVRGIIHVGQANYQEAISDFNQVIRTKPKGVDLADIYALQGISSFMIENDQQALEQLQQAVQAENDPKTKDNYQKIINAINLIPSRPSVRPKLKQAVQQGLQKITQGFVSQYMKEYFQSFRPLETTE